MNLIILTVAPKDRRPVVDRLHNSIIACGSDKRSGRYAFVSAVTTPRWLFVHAEGPDPAPEAPAAVTIMSGEIDGMPLEFVSLSTGGGRRTGWRCISQFLRPDRPGGLSIVIAENGAMSRRSTSEP